MNKPEARDAGMRLGRIHLLLQPTNALTAQEEPEFEITARFAYFRGLDEEFVRGRVGLPVPPERMLALGQCLDSERLEPNDARANDTDGSSRELVLIDAGNLRVELDGTMFDVPLSLVPDIVPYMSGVEYVQIIDELPSVLLAGPGRVTVEAEGAQEDQLPPFRVSGTLPAALELRQAPSDVAELGEDAMVLRWTPDPESDEPVVVRVVALSDSNDVFGREITCVVADHGEARLDLVSLRTLGLGAPGPLRVLASRTHVTRFDAGELIGAELRLEARERITVPER